ncbi:transglycosylase SLT domain-containing protein [Parendozoicomonas haliclonae]|uniref:transglycosylase SLT domain-containing protein n=1 Tax=Parendozoicomonas haliclonae TaxID=1960125 RepID=UPI001F625D24|nr:transglycosylase SLT domain-containing protein [Parendozoicomonas haliclonae]
MTTGSASKVAGKHLHSDCPHSFLVHHQNHAHLARLEEEYFLLGNLPQSFATQLQPTPAVRSLTAGEVFSLETHMSNRLPQYHDLFRQVAHEHRIDWHLVAAISYQESHWHPKAKSPTGVRGMMMLTLPTAKELGVRNRLDPEQSVRGGVRYLQQLKERLPETIREPDRTWQALAAYNVGIGHLYDARILARKQGFNPDKWAQLKNFLLKLEDPAWHTQTRHGFARGSEPVRYVDNIRRYYGHIMANLSRQNSRALAQCTTTGRSRG